MGFLETAVVIYLRKLYYPSGFAFPLQPIENSVAIVEIWREAATIVMLAGIGVLAGKKPAERLAYFLLSFAIWDIMYYVFLYVFLAWPQTLLTWDILFLIPVPWVGPVITPVIISLTMILFALTVIHCSGKGRKTGIKPMESLLLAAGSLVVIISFTKDYVTQKGDILFRNLRSGGSLFTDLTTYIPAQFDWWIFTLGEAIIVLSWIMYTRRVSAQGTATLPLVDGIEARA